MIELSTDNIHGDIFEIFIKYNPDLVYSMKMCDHGTNIHFPSPHHMEGDVWTHTCLCYQALNYISAYKELTDEGKVMACLAVLCHDLGKPLARQPSKAGHFRFTGHEKRSVVEIINILDFLCGPLCLNSDQVYNLMCIVSAHSVYWLADEMQDVYPLLNYNESNLEIYKVLAMADQMGQIRSTAFSANKKDIFAYNFDISAPTREIYTDMPTVYIMVGPPACGKDTLIDYNQAEFGEYDVVSYDQLRLKLYVMNNDCREFSPSEIYNKAWTWCNDNKINLKKYLYNDMLSALEKGRNVIVSNTNMTVKGRQELYKFIKGNGNYNIMVVCILCDEHTLIERDMQRKENDKSVGERVIKTMMNNFEIPTMAEGDIKLSIIRNN